MSVSFECFECLTLAPLYLTTLPTCSLQLCRHGPYSFAAIPYEIAAIPYEIADIPYKITNIRYEIAGTSP